MALCGRRNGKEILKPGFPRPQYTHRILAYTRIRIYSRHMYTHDEGALKNPHTSIFFLPIIVNRRLQKYTGSYTLCLFACVLALRVLSEKHDSRVLLFRGAVPSCSRSATKILTVAKYLLHTHSIAYFAHCTFSYCTTFFSDFPFMNFFHKIFIMQPPLC